MYSLGLEVESYRRSDSSPSAIVAMFEGVEEIGIVVLLRGCRVPKLSASEFELLLFVKLGVGRLRASCLEGDEGLLSGEEMILPVRPIRVVDVLTLELEFRCAKRLCSFAVVGKTTLEDESPNRVNFGVIS